MAPKINLQLMNVVITEYVTYIQMEKQKEKKKVTWSNFIDAISPKPK